MSIVKRIQEVLKNELEPENIKTVIDMAEFLKSKENMQQSHDVNMNKDFLINNITENDIEENLIRILKEYKKYFPGDDAVDPKSFEFKVRVGGEIYDAKYRVEKKRSGKLYIGSEAFKHRLCIKLGDKIKVTVVEKDNLYDLKNIKWKLME